MPQAPHLGRSLLGEPLLLLLLLGVQQGLLVLLVLLGGASTPRSAHAPPGGLAAQPRQHASGGQVREASPGALLVRLGPRAAREGGPQGAGAQEGGGQGLLRLLGRLLLGLPLVEL